MKINSHNEWDTLKEIIVGRAEGQASMIFSTPGPVSEELVEKSASLAKEAYPQWLIDEIAEDLEGLCKVLDSFGVKVRRPDTSKVNQVFTTPYFTAAGDNVYNMRDVHLVVGDTVVEGPSQEQHRFFEAMGLYDIWYEYLKVGFRWICAPRPKLKGDHMMTYTADGIDGYDDGQKFIKLTEEEILFEPANTVRMGKDLLYLVSRSGNDIGAKWLQSVLGEDYRVHTTREIYRSSHIDSTVLCLKPGLVMFNADRVTPQTCPALFHKWEKVYFSDIVPIPDSTLQFHNQVRKKVHSELGAMGVESNVDSIASQWIGMNVLSVNPETVLVDERQVPLMKVFEKHGLTPVPIKFRHSYLIQGGLHCSTLDTVRESKLESYFD